MASLMGDLVPFALGAAIVPGVVMVTLLLLLRSRRGPLTAAGWITGMVSVRLVQGAVFGVVVPTTPSTIAETGRPTIVATVLLVLAILMYITAADKALGGEEPEASADPPRWMAMIRSATPARALVYGTLLIVLSAKQWVFTLGAIGAIRAASIGLLAGVLIYVGFVAAVVSPSAALVAAAYLAPDRSASRLDAALGWLQTHNDGIVIGLSLLFGTLFGAKALLDFGIL